MPSNPEPPITSPKTPPPAETFDNPEFGVPAAVGSARPEVPPESLSAVKPAPKVSETQETAPVPAPAAAGRLFAPTMEMAPVTLPAPMGKQPPPKRGLSLGVWPVAGIGVGSFALGALLTWALMRQAAPPSPAASALPVATSEPATQKVPSHLPVAEVEVPRPPPERTAAKPHHPAPAAKAVEETASAGAAIKAYEAGNLEAALRMAKSANATALAKQLTDLQQALAAAGTAHGHDAGKEQAALENALKLDAAITSQASPSRAQIREALAQVHLGLGERAAKAHQQKAATDHLRTALAFHPGLPEARKQLEALGQKP